MKKLFVLTTLTVVTCTLGCCGNGPQQWWSGYRGMPGNECCGDGHIAGAEGVPYGDNAIVVPSNSTPPATLPGPATTTPANP